MKGSRLFAIRMGDWIEMRAADAPPRRVASSVQKPGVKKEWEIQPANKEHPWGWGKYVDKPFTVIIRVVVHEGGRRLCAMKLTKFKRIAQIAEGLTIPKKGGMVEVTHPQLLQMFFDVKWRKQVGLRY